uniref:Asparagine synthetase domain-containing protein 1 (Trinotate prediction) n=1 Tax=Myxobolus squamalis TaxID=59785 RepID=A0A6B2G674_MYXSQ
MDGDKMIMDTEKYVSSSKVLLSGLGADELLCGYDQYYHCYERYGEAGVLEKLNQDIAGLHHRNLGRDDRCCSDHAREIRFPYLDDKFVDFCQQIPVSFKLDMSKPKGVGNKIILRHAALNYGLPKELCFKLKKAFQFGSQFVRVSKSIGPAKNLSIYLITD